MRGTIFGGHAHEQDDCGTKDDHYVHSERAHAPTRAQRTPLMAEAVALDRVTPICRQ